MDWIQTILLIFTTLGGSTGISYFLNLRYEKSKADALAKQEHARSEDLIITNIEKLINVYNKTLADKESRWETDKVYLTNEIKMLNDKVDELSKLIQEKDINITKLTTLIKSYIDKELLWESEKTNLTTEIKTLNTKIDELSKLIQEKDINITEQTIAIKKYLSEQLEMRSELELLRNLLVNNSSTLNIITGDLNK